MELFLQELAKLGDRFYLAFVAADRWKLYFSGLGNTLAITLGAICISTVLGMLLCLMKISRYRILRGPAKAYIDVIRGIPVVVQLMFIYFVVLVTWTNKTAVGPTDRRCGVSFSPRASRTACPPMPASLLCW